MILITGGERSGKSNFAIDLAMHKEKKAFIATAEPFDDEMRSRIEKHKRDRRGTFDTFEEPLYLWKALEMTVHYDTCVIDCMTTWIGNLMYHDVDSKVETEKFLSNLNGNEIIVSNEVGMGIIPADKMTRTYVETLGKLNQEIAKMANEVFFMVAGIPLKVK